MYISDMEIPLSQQGAPIGGVAGNAAYEDLVRQAYANIGRTGDTVDQAGADYWASQLSSGAVSEADFNNTFNTAAQAYIAANPNDAVSQQVTSSGMLSPTPTQTNPYTQQVMDAYASIGRTGVGAAPNQVDQQGLDWWTNSLQQGTVSEQDFLNTFQQGVQDYIVANPDQDVSQYVGDQYYGQMIEDAYNSIGRSGFGADVNQIDQQGYDWWMDQLYSGNVSQADFQNQFQQGAAQYINNNPNDPYSQYVLGTGMLQKNQSIVDKYFGDTQQPSVYAPNYRAPVTNQSMLGGAIDPTGAMDATSPFRQPAESLGDYYKRAVGVRGGTLGSGNPEGYGTNTMANEQRSIDAANAVAQQKEQDVLATLNATANENTSSGDGYTQENISAAAKGMGYDLGFDFDWSGFNYENFSKALAAGLGLAGALIAGAAGMFSQSDGSYDSLPDALAPEGGWNDDSAADGYGGYNNSGSYSENTPDQSGTNSYGGSQGGYNDQGYGDVSGSAAGNMTDQY